MVHMNLVFDVGGTNMRVAVSRDGVEFFGEPIVEKTPHGFEDGAALLQKCANALAKGENITHVAVGVPGALDREKKILVSAPNLPGWAGKPIAERLEKIFSLPVMIENDAALAGIGEATRGAGKGFEVVAYLTVSTGVGGARIRHGVLDRGMYSFEPGNQIIDSGKTLEEFVGGAALEKRFGKKPEDIDDVSVWDDVAQKLAVGIHNIIVHWSPDIVVLSGPIAGRLSLANIRAEVKKMLVIYPEAPKIEFAVLGDSAGLIGALEYIRLDNTHR